MSDLKLPGFRLLKPWRGSDIGDIVRPGPVLRKWLLRNNYINMPSIVESTAMEVSEKTVLKHEPSRAKKR